MSFIRPVAIALMGIGVFLAVFEALHVKRKEVGTGLDTPCKRISLYVAVGIGLFFVLGGLILLFSSFDVF